MELTGRELSMLIADALAVAYTDLGNTFEFVSPDRLGEIVAERISKRILEYQDGNTTILHRIFTLPRGQGANHDLTRDFERQEAIAQKVDKVRIKIIRATTAISGQNQGMKGQLKV